MVNITNLLKKDTVHINKPFPRSKKSCCFSLISPVTKSKRFESSSVMVTGFEIDKNNDSKRNRYQISNGTLAIKH